MHPWCFFCVHISSSYKDTSQVGSGPTHLTSFNLIPLYMPQVHIQSHVSYWAWGFNTRFGGHTVQSVMLGILAPPREGWGPQLAKPQFHVWARMGRAHSWCFCSHVNFLCLGPSRGRLAVSHHSVGVSQAFRKVGELLHLSPPQAGSVLSFALSCNF